MDLSDIIIHRIREEGPICFQAFMEMCLYHPGLGYYTAGANPIGEEGDFYTSTSVSSAFGALLGRQLQEMWHNMEEKPFTIVEYGAGTGALCRDILQHLRHNTKMYDQLRYCIIEKSPAMRATEKRYLHEKVSWPESISEISGINGCIISNELLDNFSVHRVIMQEELMEVFVDYQHDFIEVLQPAGEELSQYLSELGVKLSPGFHAEINLQAVRWIEDISSALNRGYVMTIDYGYESAELYKPYRSQGTVLCYYKHSVNDLVYSHIGEQDITSHVNFSALRHWGSKNGLDECGFTDQCHFLLAMGFKEFINEHMAHEKDVFAASRKIAALTRTLLMDMGSRFKVLIQQKGLPKSRLSGLRLSSPHNNC